LLRPSFGNEALGREGIAPAKAQNELFKAAKIVSLTTGQRALKELLNAGLIQRIGKGIKDHSFRYFSRKTV
jgi:hypothetical protein